MCLLSSLHHGLRVEIVKGQHKFFPNFVTISQTHEVDHVRIFPRWIQFFPQPKTISFTTIFLLSREKVLYPFIVDFQIGHPNPCLSITVLLSSTSCMKQRLRDTWDDAWLPHTALDTIHRSESSTRVALSPQHTIAFPRPRLTIGENTSIVTLQGIIQNCLAKVVINLRTLLHGYGKKALTLLWSA